MLLILKDMSLPWGMNEEFAMKGVGERGEWREKGEGGHNHIPPIVIAIFY